MGGVVRKGCSEELAEPGGGRERRPREGLGGDEPRREKLVPLCPRTSLQEPVAVSVRSTSACSSWGQQPGAYRTPRSARCPQAQGRCCVSKVRKGTPSACSSDGGRRVSRDSVDTSGVRSGSPCRQSTLGSLKLNGGMMGLCVCDRVSHF